MVSGIKKRAFKSKSRGSQFERGLDPALQAKLDEVINEGILDSVLPFVCPNVGTSSDCNGHHSIQALKPKVPVVKMAANPPPEITTEPIPTGKKINNTPEKQVSVTSKAHIRKKSSAQGGSMTVGDKE